MTVVALIIARAGPAGMRLSALTTTAVCGMGGPRQLAWICVCGSFQFQPEQICAVTDSVSEQQRSVRSISNEDAAV